MNIFTEEFELSQKYSCIHCWDEIGIYKFNETDDGYELTETRSCQSNEETSTLWRGKNIMDLINSLRSDDEYNLEKKQRKVLISKLMESVDPAID